MATITVIKSIIIYRISHHKDTKFTDNICNHDECCILGKIGSHFEYHMDKVRLKMKDVEIIEAFQVPT